MCPLLDGAFKPLYLWDVLAIENGVEPNLQEVQFAAGRFKFTVHPHILNAEKRA